MYRNFDDIPPGVVVRDLPSLHRKEVISQDAPKQPQRMRYMWRENFNSGLIVCYATTLLLLGLLLVVCGALAIIFKAYYYTVYIGIWFGLLIFFGGIMGTVTSCYQRPWALFVFLAFSLIAMVGGIVFTIVFAFGASFDAKNEESDSWSCSYGISTECDDYAKYRTAMITTNAVASATSFFIFLFGLLSMLACLQPWVDCLRSTNPCCSPTDPLCFCCCYTPAEENTAYGKPTNLYAPVEPKYAQSPMYKDTSERPSLTQYSQPILKTQPEQQAITYTSQPAISYTSQPAISYATQPAITYTSQPGVHGL